jgi:uncharacterized protein YqiB (DUF1249 family)
MYDDFEDLKDAEFAETFTSKQIKQMKASYRMNNGQKKAVLRKKRKEKEEKVLEILKG